MRRNSRIVHVGLPHYGVSILIEAVFIGKELHTDERENVHQEQK